MLKHEALVNFPIAIFLSCLVFALIGLFYKRGLFKEIVFWNLLIGVLTGAAAIYTGIHEQEHILDRQMQEALELHRRNAYTMAGFFVFLFLWIGLRKKKMRSREYFAWTTILILGSASVAYQGIMGHEMSAQKEKSEARTETPEIKKEMNYGWNF